MRRRKGISKEVDDNQAVLDALARGFSAGIKAAQTTTTASTETDADDEAEDEEEDEDDE